MSAVATPQAPGATAQLPLADQEVQGATFDRPRARREDNPCSGGGRTTLERRLESAWEGLHAAGAVECPVCHGYMTPAHEGGRCGDCGATLH